MILPGDAVHPPTKSNEWYTPARYIEAAREVMGSIDLDPASCELANQTVKATRYYSKEDNGLAHPWYGNVWLNPPYGLDYNQADERRSSIARWVDMAIEQYQMGDIKQAIFLTTAQIDAKWFQKLWDYRICFSNHHVRFYLPHGKTADPHRKTQGHIHGTCFVYLGPHESRFIEVFSQFGTIAKRVSVAQPMQHTPSLWEAGA